MCFPYAVLFYANSEREEGTDKQVLDQYWAHCKSNSDQLKEVNRRLVPERQKNKLKAGMQQSRFDFIAQSRWGPAMLSLLLTAVKLQRMKVFV